MASFHVFDELKSTRYRPAFRFTPSQGLPAALSQYAPGKEVWIGSKLWTSGANQQSPRFCLGVVNDLRILAAGLTDFLGFLFGVFAR